MVQNTIDMSKLCHTAHKIKYTKKVILLLILPDTFVLLKDFHIIALFKSISVFSLIDNVLQNISSFRLNVRNIL